MDIVLLTWKEINIYDSLDFKSNESEQKRAASEAKPKHQILISDLYEDSSNSNFSQIYRLPKRKFLVTVRIEFAKYGIYIIDLNQLDKTNKLELLPLEVPKNIKDLKIIAQHPGFIGQFVGRIDYTNKNYLLNISDNTIEISDIISNPDMGKYSNSLYVNTSYIIASDSTMTNPKIISTVKVTGINITDFNLITSISSSTDIYLSDSDIYDLKNIKDENIVSWINDNFFVVDDLLSSSKKNYFRIELPKFHPSNLMIYDEKLNKLNTITADIIGIKPEVKSESKKIRRAEKRNIFNDYSSEAGDENDLNLGWIYNPQFVTCTVYNSSELFIVPDINSENINVIIIDFNTMESESYELKMYGDRFALLAVDKYGFIYTNNVGIYYHERKVNATSFYIGYGSENVAISSQRIYDADLNKSLKELNIVKNVGNIISEY